MCLHFMRKKGAASISLTKTTAFDKNKKERRGNKFKTMPLPAFFHGIIKIFKRIFWFCSRF